MERACPAQGRDAPWPSMRIATSRIDIEAAADWQIRVE